MIIQISEAAILDVTTKFCYAAQATVITYNTLTPYFIVKDMHVRYN